MAPLQHVLHKSRLIITDKILLQYVFAYVSSDYHFGEILPNTPCKKSFFSPVCLAICVFRLFPCGNPAPHSMQLHSFSPVCKLVCCFGLSLLKNPAQHSLQMHCFPPACFWIWHLSWLFLEILTQHSLQSNVLPYGSSDDFPVQILDHTRCS